MAVIVPIAAKYDPKGINQAKKGFASLSKSVKGALAGLGIGLGLGAIAGQLKAASKAAVDDAKSQGLLAQSLRNSIGATTDQIAAVEKSISKMELMSSVADDNIRPAFAVLSRATGDVTNATNLMQLALDVSAGTGKDLNSVSAALAKAYGGQTTALNKLVPGVATANDKFSWLQKNFEGAAAAAANLDPYQRLEVIFGNLQEQIGVALLPYLEGLAGYFASTDGQQALKDFADNVAGIATSIADLAGTIASTGILDTLNTFLKTAGQVAKLDLKGANDTLNTSFYKGWLDKYTNNYAAFSRDIAVVKENATDTYKNIMAYVKANAKKQTGMSTTLGEFYAQTGTKITPNVITPTPIFGQKYKIPTGTNSAAAAAKAAAAKLAAANQKAAEAAKKAAAQAAQDLEDALNAQRDALAAFKDELLGLSDAIQPLKATERQIGEFESAAIASFDNITESIKSGLANDVITKEAAAKLQAYVKTERVALEAIARQRDELANKRSLVEALIGDVKAAVVGYANITNLLDTQTRTVEQTITRTVGSLTIATKRSIEEVVTGNGLVGNLQDVVTRTKAFALQLKQLRELGLDQNLYKQIVDAGIEAGSATAAEIIKGGAGTVKELNSLFAELNTVGIDIAEQTASVMYNNGQLIAGGLVEGLKSQEAALVAAATALANAFTSTYNSLVGNLQTPMESQTIGLTVADIAAGNMAVAGSAAGSNSFNQLRNMASALAARGGGGITITVNAGVGTNGKAVGQAIYDELNKYLKASNQTSLVK